MEYNLQNVKDIVAAMYIGDKQSIRLGLNHPGALVRTNAIVNATRYRYDEKEITDEIKKLKNDTSIVCGCPVCKFAAASLHLLHVESYEGKDDEVCELIDSNLEF